MTGTAATQSLEFAARSTACEVETIPTNRPVIRVDHPDVVFATKAEKEQAVLRGDPPGARDAASRCWSGPRASPSPSGSARCCPTCRTRC